MNLKNKNSTAWSLKYILLSDRACARGPEFNPSILPQPSKGWNYTCPSIPSCHKLEARLNYVENLGQPELQSKTFKTKQKPS